MARQELKVPARDYTTWNQQQQRAVLREPYLFSEYNNLIVVGAGITGQQLLCSLAVQTH